MKILDLLSLKPFSKSHLRTGGLGLNNPIESAMVLEAVDIERWGTKNQLILTSYFALKDLGLSELEKFFSKLHTIGISGIVIKLNRLINTTPEALIQLCKTYAIPLIEIGGNTNYEHILTAIYEPLLNRQSSLLRTYYEASKIFSSLKNTSATYQEILDQLHNLTGKPCRLRIPRSDLVIDSGNIIDNWTIESSHALKTEYTNNSYTITHLTHPNQKLDLYKIKIKYKSVNLIPFSISIFQNEEEFDHSHIMIVENAMEAIQHKLQIEQSINNEYYNIYNNIAASILFNTTANKQERDDLLEETQLTQFPFYQAIGIGKHIKHDNEKFHQLRRRLQKISPYHLYYENRKYIIILFNLENSHQTITLKSLEKYVEKPFEYNLVISSMTSKEEIHHLFNECLDMIRFNREYHVFNVMTISDLGIFRHLLDSDNQFFDTRLAKELIELKKKKSDLFDTFLNFILCHQNYQLTAEKMFLHPKTIRYRINKIQDLLGFNLQNPIQNLNYSIATIMANLNPQ